VRRDKLWVPPLKGIYFKGEAYLGGRDWLEHNDGGAQRLVFRMRLAAAVLAVALSLVIFFAAREWFGTTAALVALTLAVFDANLLAHSRLVTTDLGAALFFLAAIYAFYRLVKQPTLLRVLIAGVMAGLLLATKHSGILLAPILLSLIVWEVAFAPRGEWARQALRLAGAFAVIMVVAIGILWGFYGFWYAARPAGLKLTPTLSAYSNSLTRFPKGTIWWMAHLHLLPESYLFGMVDVRVFARVFSTFVLGGWHPHGVWWYFPAVFAIKTTVGLMALLGLAVFAMVTGNWASGRTRIAFARWCTCCCPAPCTWQWL
jgi:4-amino-4-deoxy-L-arabinose transferase-like glycosyltransferase